MYRWVIRFIHNLAFRDDRAEEILQDYRTAYDNQRELISRLRDRNAELQRSIDMLTGGGGTGTAYGPDDPPLPGEHTTLGGSGRLIRFNDSVQQ